jgi:RNA polymerase sigma factor (sigma-70 family)
MPDKDRTGKPIPQSLLEAAQLVWPRVRYLAERELRDGAKAAEILEKAVYVVARVLERQSPQAGILNMDSYLYWAAARTLFRSVEREKMVQFIEDLEPVLQPKTGRYRDHIGGTQQQLLIRQIIRYMDSRTRSMFLLRVKGYTWEEVGRFLGIKANNAAVAYSTGVEKARQRILRCRTGHSKPAARGER